MRTREEKDRTPQPKWRTALDASASIGMLIAAGVFIWGVVVTVSRTEQEPVTDERRGPRAARERGFLPTAPVAFEPAPSMGSPTAQVVVIEYSDFECPFCRRFASETLAPIKDSYVTPGKVRLVFKHFPLESIHQSALMAAEAAECAHRQGRFWDMHDALIEEPMPLLDTALLERASSLGLDGARFKICLGGEARSKVRDDIAAAQVLRITGTPTFLFGMIDEESGYLKVMRRASGALSVSAFASTLDELLSLEVAR